MRELQGVQEVTPWYPRLYPLPETWQLICHEPCKHPSQRVIPDDCGTLRARSSSFSSRATRSALREGLEMFLPISCASRR